MLCYYWDYSPPYYVVSRLLELCALRCTREGDDVADVLHTGYEEDESLEAETESAVGA